MPLGIQDKIRINAYVLYLMTYYCQPENNKIFQNSTGVKEKN